MNTEVTDTEEKLIWAINKEINKGIPPFDYVLFSIRCGVRLARKIINKIRYPRTKLSRHELEYCINDVRGLVEAVKAQMARDGDNLYTIPMTSTGYPRREMKRAMRLYCRQALRDMQPNY